MMGAGARTVDYRLSAQDIAEYQFARRDRLSLRVRHLGILFHLGWGLVLAVAAAATFLASAALLPGFTKREFANEELFLGLGLGMIFFVAVNWLNYFIRRRVLVKPDGPTLSQHSMTIE